MSFVKRERFIVSLLEDSVTVSLWNRQYYAASIVNLREEIAKPKINLVLSCINFEA